MCTLMSVGLSVRSRKRNFESAPKPYHVIGDDVEDFDITFFKCVIKINCI